MTVRFYSSLDAGAPVLSGDLFARLRQVMLACLVNGYGSKSAAGWSVGHDVTDGFSLGNGDGFINFVRSGANGYVAYILESLSNISAAIAAGDNQRSAGYYNGSGSTERQSFYADNAAFNGSSNPHWFVVADAKTCIFHFAGGTTTADSTSAGRAHSHYFGRYISALGLTGAAEFCSLGGGYQLSVSQAFGVSGSRYGMALRNPYTGLIDQGALARYGASAPINVRSGQPVSAATKLLPSRLQLVRAALMCHGVGLTGTTNAADGGIAGYLRGVISEPTLCTALLSNVMTLFGKSNTWQMRVTPITMPNGKQWVPMWLGSGDAAFFVSLDALDWE